MATHNKVTTAEQEAVLPQGTTSAQWLSGQIDALIERHRLQQAANESRDLVRKLERIPDVAREVINGARIMPYCGVNG